MKLIITEGGDVVNFDHVTNISKVANYDGATFYLKAEYSGVAFWTAEEQIITNWNVLADNLAEAEADDLLQDIVSALAYTSVVRIAELLSGVRSELAILSGI